jgi:LCP family protein required for cell wall assembly
MPPEKLRAFWLRLKRKIFRYPLVVKLACYLIIGAFIFLLIYFVSPGLIKIIKKVMVGPKMAFSLLSADTASLDVYNNRVNLLILGIGGKGHEELDLTDTIIFASIDRTTADAAMFSVPRDIWLDSLKTKINATYHYGEEKAAGGGFVLMKDAVYQILNQPIHYAILIDFEGFVQIIDLLGGVKIKVDRSFDDYKYPIPGKGRDECGGDPEYKCRYEHLHFESGEQEMNGETALKFVRSRNAEGEEGTDFARSKRQQKVILAVAKKLFSYQVLLSPTKIMELKKTFGDHVKFDNQFNEEQITAFLSLFLRFKKNKNEIRTISLDAGDEDSPGFLYNPAIHESNQWVLIPRAEDWSEVQKYVEEKIYKGY